jgi:putative chitinase
VTNAPASVSAKSADEWMSILFALGVREKTARHWGPGFAEIVRSDAFSMGWEEIDDFVAQIVHESAMLEYVVENLNYRVERLHVVWPRRFTNLTYAKQYANNPVALGNRVYGGRMGNDREGEGFLYRGRSPLMITGKDNYELVQVETGEPVVDKPELLETPRVGLKAAVAWWERRIPDSIVNNSELVSRHVNGGDTGLTERVRLARLSDQLI